MRAPRLAKIDPFRAVDVFDDVRQRFMNHYGGGATSRREHRCRPLEVEDKDFGPEE